MSTLIQRIVLAIAILEIPLQIDTYWLYQEQDAQFGALGGINVSLFALAVFVLYAMWLAEAALQPSEGNSRIVWGVPLIVYIGVTALSAIAAEKWLLTFFEVVLLAQAFLLFFYVANRMQKRSDVVFLMCLLAASVALQGFIFTGTYLIGGPRVFSFGIVQAVVHADGRPGGTMWSPTVAGSYLALLVLPVGSLLLAPVSKRVKQLAFVAVVMGTLALVLTQTRGAILSLSVAALIFGFCTFRRGWLPRWTPVAVLLIAAITAVPLLYVLKHRVQGDDDGSAASRVYLSSIALQIIKGNPTLGIGANNGHLEARKIANSGRYRSEWFYTIHSKYLLVLAETGVLGFAAYLAFLFTTLYKGWQSWKLNDRLLSTIALALTAGIAGQMIHMSVDIFNSREQVQILFCCAAIVAGIARLQASAVVSPRRPSINRAYPALAGRTT